MGPRDAQRGANRYATVAQRTVAVDGAGAGCRQWYDVGMDEALEFRAAHESDLSCVLDLDLLYPQIVDRQRFEEHWPEFLDADPSLRDVLQRTGSRIRYPHKSWLPATRDGRPAVLFLFGNPAPHSVRANVYFAYEGAGGEHRFWRVMRELGFADLHGHDPAIRRKFLELQYESPFRLGLEVIHTFPSSASGSRWSGVLGMERLFGRRAATRILTLERNRLTGVASNFLQGGGAVIAMHKDAYNALASNRYDLSLAVTGGLRSQFEGRPVYGTPPTRWLHSTKMKSALAQIGADVLHTAG